MLIPKPSQITMSQGSFNILKLPMIILDSGCSQEDLGASRCLQAEISKLTGFKPEISKAFTQKHESCIVLKRISAPAQSYQIDIDKNTGVVISGGDSSGLFYGVQTLCQLLRIHGADLPCMNINDKPFFKNRGFYHDVTRGKVPKLETLMELCDRISFYKLNQLQLYVEHTFAFKNQSEVWTGKDPLTAEEILLLDEYCTKRHVELVPSLSTFGHLYHALCSISFKHLNEFQIDEEDPFTWLDRMHHYTIDVSNSESLDFVKDMLDEFIPLFSSDKFNICCDETFDLGVGKNKELALEVGKGKLYVDFLNKIIHHVKSHNKKVMFWGDIIVGHPEYINEIPEDVICLNWNYNSDAPEEPFEKMASAGYENYACPGVSGWNNLVSRMDTAYANIDRIVGFGVKYGASGVLNTDWGDFGHINLLSASIPGMAYGADLSWNPKVKSDWDEADRRVSLIEFGDRSERIVGFQRKLAQLSAVNWWQVVLWYYDKIGLETKPYKYEEEVVVPFKEYSEEDIKGKYKNIMDISDEILKLSPGIFEQRAVDIREYHVAARGQALFLSLLLIIKDKDFEQEIKELIHTPSELASALEIWLSSYSTLWRIRNKESELYRIRELITNVCGVLRGYQKI